MEEAKTLEEALEAVIDRVASSLSFFFTFLLLRMKNRGDQSMELLAITAGTVAANGVTWPGFMKALHKAAMAYGVHVATKMSM